MIRKQFRKARQAFEIVSRECHAGFDLDGKHVDPFDQQEIHLIAFCVPVKILKIGFQENKKARLPSEPSIIRNEPAAPQLLNSWGKR
jgi:hypothetical protein